MRYREVTLRPVGVDGSAVVTYTAQIDRPGCVRAISVDYQNQPATVDLVIKANNSTGATLFTNTSSNTDIVGKPVGMPGIDEGNAAIAATDASAGGWFFKTGLYFDVAQGDGQTSGNEAIVIGLWLDV